ncbi:MAG: hypothetical protein M3O46_11430, partial [Myxococcota bacterium]|nr:hypothetical protein [Myxococcota bacterium]
NLPAKALETAMRITGKGLTPTLVQGLVEIERAAQRSALKTCRKIAVAGCRGTRAEARGS